MPALFQNVGNSFIAAATTVTSHYMLILWLVCFEDLSRSYQIFICGRELARFNIHIVC